MMFQKSYSSLWEYEMRSNRSNSLSSTASTESGDSAYRSAPGTPRSTAAGHRSSPYLQAPSLSSMPEEPPIATRPGGNVQKVTALLSLPACVITNELRMFGF